MHPPPALLMFAAWGMGLEKASVHVDVFDSSDYCTYWLEEPPFVNLHRLCPYSHCCTYDLFSVHFVRVTATRSQHISWA